MKKTTSASVIRYIDDTTAQVTKAFEKKACIFGTEEFKLWREYKAMLARVCDLSRTTVYKYITLLEG